MNPFDKLNLDILFQPLQIGRMTLRNRLVLPPIACFGWSGADGLFGEKHIQHYQSRAEDGVGLIIVEGSAVLPGRSSA